jgi:hypothetical protein
VSKQNVIDNTGFEMLFEKALPITSEPTDEELRILRTQVDPLGLVIGKH